MPATVTSLILQMLAFASSVPPSVAEPPVEPITIPNALKNVTARVSVSSTSCSVTCGLGYKQEETCEVGPDGNRTACIIQRLDCMTNWICGMSHFTVLVGKPFELSCLSDNEVGPETQSFSYSWRLARGIITTDDALFMPLKVPSFVIKLSPAEEYDAGTYRCDVQLIKSYKLVKRIYFGLRVIPGRLVNLNFEQSLIEGQQLENEGQNQKNVTHMQEQVQEQRESWRKRVVIVFAIGIGSGVLGGILLYYFLYCFLKMLWGREDK